MCVCVCYLNNNVLHYKLGFIFHKYGSKLENVTPMAVSCPVSHACKLVPVSVQNKCTAVQIAKRFPFKGVQIFFKCMHFFLRYKVVPVDSLDWASNFFPALCLTLFLILSTSLLCCKTCIR